MSKVQPLRYDCRCGALAGDFCTDEHGRPQMSCPSRGHDGRSAQSPTAIRRARGTDNDSTTEDHKSLNLFGARND